MTEVAARDGTREAGEQWGRRVVGRDVVDVDVHAAVPSIEALFPYLPPFWREYVEQSGFKGPVDTPYPKAPTSARAGTQPEGGPPGSSLDLLRQQALDPWGTRLAILNCSYAVESIHNPDAEVALARAVNDWLIERWLTPEPRLRGSLVVPSKQPLAAAAEIDRVGPHPAFVQVYLPARSSIPYGKRHWHPLFEAAERRGLAVGLHFGGAPGAPPTAVGWPSYYLEEYAGMAQIFQSQLQSIVVEGVFERFPSLRIACLEGGFAWLPPFLWRLDKEWKGLRREVPWTKRLPSAYVRDHVRFSLQPLDAPSRPERVAHLFEQLGSDELVMFSTDYPHWHFDRAAEALPSGIGPALERKIMSENARAFYRLEEKG